MSRYTYARKKQGQQKGERQPGQVSAALRRRMGPALADIFDEYGPDIYSNAVLGLKDTSLSNFQEGFDALDATVQKELGRRGREEAQAHIRAWAAEIMDDINHFGLDEVAKALEDHVSSQVAEFTKETGEEGEDLLEIEPGGAEAVEEVEEEDVEPVEEAGEEDAESVDLEDLDLELPGGEEEAAASFGPLGGRRRRQPTRRIRRTAIRPHQFADEPGSEVVYQRILDDANRSGKTGRALAVFIENAANAEMAHLAKTRYSELIDLAYEKQGSGAR